MAQITETRTPRPSTTPTGMRATWGSQKFQDRLLSTVCTIIAVLGVLIILFPLGWMISTSLKTRFEAIQFPPSLLPAVPQWDNYRVALTSNPFLRYFQNTMFYCLSYMVIETVSVGFIAYGFARLRAPGKDFIFLLMLSTLMLPGDVTLVPRYIMFARLHWLNSYKPLIFPALFGSAYLIFMVRQFYRGLPRDYEEAAIIDGASYFGIWWRIILPLSKPALGAVAILSFMFHYNDFQGPLLYISDNLKYPLSLGLQQFRAPFGGTAFHLLMAASLVTILPPVLVFFATQRFFIQGIVVSGVKG
jgi:ABC-type glycerol-3-phosphate transport system permease component